MNRKRVADPLQRESAVRAVVTSRTAAGNKGTERGAPPRAANLKAYHGERQRKREPREQGNEKRGRDTLERKGCVVGGNLKEVGTRERRRGDHEGEESGRVGEYRLLRRGGAQPGTGERKSRAPARLSSSSVSPLVRGKFDLLATFYRLLMLILERAGS